jgi:hypothetical protein
MKITTRIPLFLLLSICLAGSKSYAQKTEVGVIVGGSYYWGDIVNTWQPSTIKPAGTFFIRYHIDPRLAFRGGISYASLEGADASSESLWQRERNFSFNTQVYELAGVVEYNLLPDKNKGRRLKTRFIPYVSGGLALYYFDPKAVNPVTGKEVQLRNLKLDGETYSPIAFSIPLGVGFRYYLTRNWQIGFELGARYSLSSNLDNVRGTSEYVAIAEMTNDDARIMMAPQQARVARILESGDTYSMDGARNASVGDPRGKNGIFSDVYFIGGVSLSYRLWPRGARSYGGRAIRCPRFY